tara:strand:- start:536 stop:1534 length:999 start_codon:yes stop_codon:yes gene_type:complete
MSIQQMLLGSGGAVELPQITNFNDLFTSTSYYISGNVTHNGYGFELYTGYKDGSGVYYADMDVSNISVIRFVIMGGGGGASGDNIESASAGCGFEGYWNVSSQTSIKLKVGAGGAGYQGPGYNASSTNDGGHSSVLNSSSNEYARADGGTCAGRPGYTSRPSAPTYNSTYIVPISAARGGMGGQYVNQSDREPLVTISPTLSGAYAHGACSGAHARDMANDNALGYGGGGGGTYGYTHSPGGPLGYRGGLGSSSGGTYAQGPATHIGTSYGRNSVGYSGYTNPQGGGGGGAFGGAACEIYDVGEGATGLVKVWWADNTGDPSVLTTTGNLYS